jgi:hypothetical protein
MPSIGISQTPSKASRSALGQKRDPRALVASILGGR